MEWFQDVESMMNHHLAGLLGLGSLAWAGHVIHIGAPTAALLDAIDAGSPLLINASLAFKILSKTLSICFAGS